MTIQITTAPLHKRADREQRYVPRLGMLFLAALIVATFALSGCGGGGDGASATNAQPTDGQPTDGQPPSVPSGTGTANLAWSAPTTNVDGTPLTTLAGYKVYYGTTPGVYTSIVVGNASSYEITGLANGQTYYFTVTAYDTYGIESDFAPVVSKLVS
jgi:hypothetical protein